MNKEEKLLFEANKKRILELEAINKKLAIEIESKNNTIANINLSSKNNDDKIKELVIKEKKLKEQLEIIEIQEATILKQKNIILEQKSTIKEQKEMIDKVKAYLIENNLMKKKLINQLFGLSSAKTKNLIQKQLDKDTSFNIKLKKEKETETKQRGRTQGKQNFDNWKDNCFYNEIKIVEDVKQYLESTCPTCGLSSWEISGYDEVIKISLIPQRIKRTTYRYPILKCKNCGEKIRTYLSQDCFNKLACTPSLAGFLSMLSCGLFLPYKRIEDYFTYAGTPISRELITKYCITTSNLLTDFVEKVFHKEMMKADVLHLDETVALNLNEKEHTINRIWGATTGKHDKIQATYYLYSSDRKHINFLGGEKEGKTYKGLISKEFNGTIVTNSYSAYMCDMVHSLCWSHLRKYIFDYLQANQNEESLNYQDMKKLLDKINEIFALDRTFDLLPSEERIERRKNELKPLIEEYFMMAEKIYDPNIDDMKNKAINYGLKNKELYMTLLEKDKVPLTNNRAEVSMRKYVMKRVSSMFSQSTEGINATCILLSLVQTARMNHLQPDGYIQYLLQHLDDLKDERKAKEYLPWSNLIPSEIRLQNEDYKKAKEEVEKQMKSK